MKSHKKILARNVICIAPEDSIEAVNNYNCTVEEAFEAMNLAAKQAFEAAKEGSYTLDEKLSKYRTFEDYLKDLNDD